MCCLFIILVYTRFVGLDWGLPYPMHPDERNIAVAILELNCSNIMSPNCLHPHFFAYGQFSIYLGSILAHILGFVRSFSWQITFEDATLALRILSASASVVAAFVLVRTMQAIFEKINVYIYYLMFLIVIFVPGFIQFAHFGTTESLLMMFYALLLYFAVKFIMYRISLNTFVSMSGMLLGMALGTKVSALIFVAIPSTALVFKVFEGMQIRPFIKLIFASIQLFAIAIVFFIISSPFNLIAWTDFMGSMNYESSVGLGTYRAFYTRQFEYTVPFIFQLVKILPYTLGGPLFLIAVLAFIFLPFTKVFNFLRLQIIIFLIPTMIIYAKWARFLSPVFPVITLLGILYLVQLLSDRFDRAARSMIAILACIIVAAIVIPGIAYLSIYSSPDVRFVASQWIYKNIPVNSYILSETANVVDTPIPSDIVSKQEYEGKYYNYISFNHYDLDQEAPLQMSFTNHLREAQYIFVPSRRVFYNHTCYRNVNGTIKKASSLTGYEGDVCRSYEARYPMLNTYYTDLFSGKSGYTQVAEFTSYPRIEIGGIKLIEFPDESAEETWTVFDHPVIRIYKKSS